MSKEFPYKTTFAFTIKPVVSKEKDKYLSKASLEQLSKFIPTFESVDLPTLLPVSFNICVVNRVNKNDDVIDTETALASYKKFINAPINAEHKRDRVIGCVLTAGFSEFGTDKSLTEEEVKSLKSPFNITLGGIIWRVVNEDIADLIEESNDPTSKNYMGISASWELGFTQMKVLALDEGQKNVEDGIILTDKEAIATAFPLLKSNGGTGKSADDKHLYRMPYFDVTPLGCGITEHPAADVVGIAVKTTEKEEVIAVEEDKNKKTEEIISQSQNTNVKEEEEIIIAMKLNSLKDLTDTNLKEATAAQISDLFAAELAEKSKVWEKEKSSVTDKLAQAEEQFKKSAEEAAKLKKDMESIQANLDKLNQEKLEREQVEKFNVRMNEVSEAYEFDEEVSAEVVKEIKSLASDEDFDKWKAKAAKFFKPFKKGKKDDKSKEKSSDTEKTEDCKASEAKASTDTVVDKALDNAEKEKGGLPNTASSEKQTLKEKYAAAFSKENFVISK